jgi:hypothetical protein
VGSFRLGARYRAGGTSQLVRCHTSVSALTAVFVLCACLES